jgi:hypothetical protein
VIALIRQFLQPPAFRITAPKWPTALRSLQAYECALEEFIHAHTAVDTKTSVQKGSAATEAANLEDRLIVDVGTGLWRLRQRLVDRESGEPLESTRMAYRHFASTWDALVEAGVDVQDHTNQSYDSGQSIRVIAFQPTSGLQRDTVLETIRPSIYYKGKRVQMGEVIIGTPIST